MFLLFINKQAAFMPLGAERLQAFLIFLAFSFFFCLFYMLQEICNVFPHVEFPYFLESISGIIPLEVSAVCCQADLNTLGMQGGSVLIGKE